MATRPARPPATQAAYVLHRYDWSESSLILDLFTREQGRIAVVAKGAKRPYSQLRPVLLPFQRIQVTLGKPPRASESSGGSSGGSSGESASDVQTLRGAEWAGGHAMLTGAALFSGFYLNELLMKLLARSDAHPMLFDAYAQTLALLASTDDGAVQTALRAFELALLQQVGVLPDLSRVTMTQDEVDPAGRYLLLPEQGVATSRGRENELAGQTLIGLQAALQHGSLAALQQACAPALQELKLLLRALLHYHLGSSVLRTRQVMLDVQALER